MQEIKCRLLLSLGSLRHACYSILKIPNALVKLKLLYYLSPFVFQSLEEKVLALFLNTTKLLCKIT